MGRRLSALALPVAAVLVGCVSTDRTSGLVPASSPGTPPSSLAGFKAAPPPVSAASEQAAVNVGRVGDKLVSANPACQLHPVFKTVGAPHDEIFHRGDGEIIITEALARKCKTEGQLAAVLAVELGKMASEHEASQAPSRLPDRLPPMEVSVGQQIGGAQDLSHMMELAHFEKEQNERRREAAIPPDPNTLALGFLEKAGYAVVDLEAVAPLLRGAEANMTLEKAMGKP